MELSRIKQLNDELDYTGKLIQIFSNSKSDSISKNRNEIYCKEFYAASVSAEDKVQLFEHLITNYSSFSKAEKTIFFLKDQLEEKIGRDDVEALLTFSYQMMSDKYPTIDPVNDPMASFDENLTAWTLDNYNKNLELLYLLIASIYFPRWNSKEKEHFQATFKLLKENFLFFISFTRQMCQPENARFKNIIDEHFKDKKEEVETNWSKVNYPAKLIEFIVRYKRLRKYFFDEASIDLGTDFKNRIDASLPKTLTLVQIISEASFNGASIWPFYEYFMFCKELDNKKVPIEVKERAFIFIVLDDIDTYNITGNKKEWFDHVKRITQFRLGSSTSYTDFISKLNNLNSTIEKSHMAYIKHMAN